MAVCVSVCITDLPRKVMWFIHMQFWRCCGWFTESKRTGSLRNRERQRKADLGNCYHDGAMSATEGRHDVNREQSARSKCPPKPLNWKEETYPFTGSLGQQQPVTRFSLSSSLSLSHLQFFILVLMIFKGAVSDFFLNAIHKMSIVLSDTHCWKVSWEITTVFWTA